MKQFWLRYSRRRTSPPLVDLFQLPQKLCTREDYALSVHGGRVLEQRSWRQMGEGDFGAAAGGDSSVDGGCGSRVVTRVINENEAR